MITGAKVPFSMAGQDCLLGGLWIIPDDMGYCDAAQIS